MADKIAVSFSKGLLANLPATKTPGKIYITTDERALYMDVDAETRIRLGDFQSFANVAALNANTNPSTTALYYVEDINCLAKWDGSKYVQINRDTGATDVETTGDGNAVTSATYDAATRKLTLSKGVTFALPSDITTAIQGLNKTDTAVSGKYVSAVSESNGVITVTREDLPDYSNTYDAKGAADAVKGTDADTSASETVKGARLLANEKVASVGATANKGIEIGGTATAPTVGVKLSAKDGNELSFATGEGEDGGLYFKAAAAAEYSIVKDENSGDYAAVYHLTKGGANTGVAINIPKDQFIKSGKVETKSEAGAWGAAGTYLVIELQNTNDILYVNVGDLIEYVTSGSQAGDMVFVTVDATTHKVTATITDGTITAAKLTAELQTKIGQAHTHENKTLLDTYTQTEANLSDAVAKKHEHSNATVLDGITAAKVSAWDGKQDELTFDSAPTSGSSNPVTSGGVYTALQNATLEWGSF